MSADRPADLVRVAVASNQAEAEFIQALLREEGIASVLRRTAGFDVPDFMAAGPRDVLVARATELEAREVLMQAEVIGSPTEQRYDVQPLRLLVWLLAALALGALIVWLLSLLVR